MITLIKQKGSIALISILLISAITLIAVIGMSEMTISGFSQYANKSSTKISYYLAESCLEEALLRAEDDDSFATTTITLDPDTTCTVTIAGAGPKTAEIDVTYLNYTETFQGEFTINESGQANNVSLSKWKEI